MSLELDKVYTCFLNNQVIKTYSLFLYLYLNN